jgi:signal transduction histidine kinase
LIGEDVTVTFNPGSGLGLVKADRGQLVQIIMNLAVNARDAMPHGGAFIIETANVEFDASEARLNPEERPGPYVMLAVRDTGFGIDKATQARIFEPFFTTKAIGKGTGLGLSVVYGIVKQSGGFITVWSDLGHGPSSGSTCPPCLRCLTRFSTANQGPSQGAARPSCSSKMNQLCSRRFAR